MKHLRKYNENIDSEMYNQLDQFIIDLDDEFDIVKRVSNDVSFESGSVIKTVHFNRSVIMTTITDMANYKEMLKINNYIIKILNNINIYLEGKMKFELSLLRLQFMFKCNKKFREFLFNDNWVGDSQIYVTKDSDIRLYIPNTGSSVKLNDDFSLEIKAGLKGWKDSIKDRESILNLIDDELSKFGFETKEFIDGGYIILKHPNIVEEDNIQNMKYLLTYKLFETEILSKSQQRNKEWHDKNPPPKGTIINPDDLDRFNIPDSIKNEMLKWNIIFKSPFSNSFYSSDDISWSHKPHNSYRVSDHWNFTTNRSDKVHCKTTEPVKNTSHISLGKFDGKIGKYEMLLSEISFNQLNKIRNKEEREKYLKDPEIIKMKKKFKEDVNSGDIFIEIKLKDGINIRGQVDKYTGYELRIKDVKGEVIYSENYLRDSNVISIKLFDKSGNKINNPFRLNN